ncbi:MAG: MBL fold metallo-hydrolase [Phycisphaerae bacterium]
MIIETRCGGLADTNGYLVGDETTQEAVLIDAPQDAVNELLELAQSRGLKIKAVFFTHGHWDHLVDHDLVRQAVPGVKFYMHRLDEPMLIKPGSSLYQLPFTIPPGKIDVYLEDGQKLTVGSLKFEVLHVPGHAPGLCAFYCAAEKALFSGDLLFAGGVGRYDFPGCSITDLQASLRRVMKLPDDTRVYSGHGGMTQIGWERQGNAFIRQWKLG